MTIVGARIGAGTGVGTSGVGGAIPTGRGTGDDEAKTVGVTRGGTTTGIGVGAGATM
jgi:hypothetical protein